MSIVKRTEVTAALSGGTPPEGPALLVVDVDSVGHDHPIPPATPVIVLGVSAAATPPVVDLGAYDLLLSTAANASRPWAWTADIAGAVERLRIAVTGSPLAAVSLIHLLRIAEPLPPTAAVVAESAVYSMLLAGPEFATWLDRTGARPAPPPPDHPTVAVTRDDAFLRIRLTHPERRNAYGVDLRDAFVEALTVADLDPSVTRIELSAEGPDFCSGGDLTEFGTTPDVVTAHLIRMTAGAAPVMARLGARCTAVVQGRAIGGGAELAAFAAHVIVYPDASFRLPEIAMGLIPGAGGTVSLTQRIGRHRAGWLILTGEWLDAQTALSWGLADALAS